MVAVRVGQEIRRRGRVRETKAIDNKLRSARRVSARARRACADKPTCALRARAFVPGTLLWRGAAHGGAEASNLPLPPPPDMAACVRAAGARWRRSAAQARVSGAWRAAWHSAGRDGGGAALALQDLTCCALRSTGAAASTHLAHVRVRALRHCVPYSRARGAACAAAPSSRSGSSAS